MISTVRFSSAIIIVICLLTCSAALLMIWLQAAKNSPPPLFIQFIGYTNYTGEKFATFSVTNGSAMQQQFYAFGQTPHDTGGWEEFDARSEQATNAYWTYLPSGKSARFSILVFQPHVPYRLSLKVNQPDSKWRQWRRIWSEWFVIHHLPRIGQVLFKDHKDPIISSPEVQQ